MKSKLLYLCLLLFPIAVFAQQRQLLAGKVTIGGDAGTGLFVINSKTGEETKTDSNGNFSINAKPGDRLAVYSSKTQTREFVISENTFRESPYLMRVDYKTYELEEVEINKYRKINSEALGLVPQGQKQYTPAERRLKTAAEMKPIFFLGALGGAIPLDPIINAISGRTRMLKGALATEKKELLIEKVNGLYNEDEIISGFDIPKEYVNGFIFYIVENEEFADALKSDSTEHAKFLMGTLAKEYLVKIKE